MAISRGGVKADERLFGAAETMRKRLKSFFERPCSPRIALPFKHHAMMYNIINVQHPVIDVLDQSLSSWNPVSARLHHGRWSYDAIVWRCFTLFWCQLHMPRDGLTQKILAWHVLLRWCFQKWFLQHRLCRRLLQCIFSLPRMHCTIKQALPIVIIFLRLQYIQPV